MGCSPCFFWPASGFFPSPRGKGTTGTDIPALDATLKADRAGEVGAGLALAAGEVRALAKRSADSARETAEMIAQAIAKSEQGVRLSGGVVRSPGVILERTRKVDNAVKEIVSASEEQTVGINQVVTSAGQFDKVTQSNAASSRETLLRGRAVAQRPGRLAQQSRAESQSARARSSTDRLGRHLRKRGRRGQR